MIFRKCRDLVGSAPAPAEDRSLSRTNKVARRIRILPMGRCGCQRSREAMAIVALARDQVKREVPTATVAAVGILAMAEGFPDASAARSPQGSASRPRPPTDATTSSRRRQASTVEARSVETSAESCCLMSAGLIRYGPNAILVTLAAAKPAAVNVSLSLSAISHPARAT